jgi:dihydrofolate synthase/folylpolyglutamate synthase
VIGSRDVPRTLLDAATAIGARCKRLGSEFDAVRGVTGWRYRGSRWKLEDLPPPALAGEAQYANAATAIAALEELAPRLEVSAAALRRGLASAHLPGRFQIIAPGAGRPSWILDVAHNPDAARVLRANLQALPATGRTLAVCGILADKDAPAIAAEVRGCFDAWWLASTEGARGTSADRLAARIAAPASTPVALAGDVASACRAASAAALPGDRIVVFGSFHTVGPALDWLEGFGLLPPQAVPDYHCAPRAE